MIEKDFTQRRFISVSYNTQDVDTEMSKAFYWYYF